MGWFSSTPSPSPPPSATPPATSPTSIQTSEATYHFPSRTSRQACWTARDRFFECLDKHNIIDANKNPEEVRRGCAEEEKGFEKECVRSWVEYFKKRRVMEAKKELLLSQLEKEGAQRMDVPGKGTGGK